MPGALELFQLIQSRGRATAGEDQGTACWSRLNGELAFARQQSPFTPNARESHAEAAATGEERQVDKSVGDEVEVLLRDGVNECNASLDRGCASP
jgi:hypothetical protein